MSPLQEIQLIQPENMEVMGVVQPYNDPLLASSENSRQAQSNTILEMDKIDLGKRDVFTFSEKNPRLHGEDIGTFDEEEIAAMAVCSEDEQVNLNITQFERIRPEAMRSFVANVVDRVKKDKHDTVADKGLEVQVPDSVLEDRLTAEHLKYSGLKRVQSEEGYTLFSTDSSTEASLGSLALAA